MVPVNSINFNRILYEEALKRQLEFKAKDSH